MEIRDEGGDLLAPGNNGEVWIGGEHLADGYWGQPEETRRVFVGGWLRTGDLGVLDAEGYLFLRGRSDDQINVGGLKLMPSEVESVLMELPGVADAAVVGIADAAGIEETVVGAMIVTEPQVSMCDEDVDQLCRKKLEPHMVPKKIVFVAALPRAESGKILRADIQRILEDALAETGGDT